MAKDKEYWNPFYDIAESPNYLYVYVSVLYAWGLKPSKRYFFLHDIKKKKNQCVDKEGKKVKLPFFHKRIKVDEMFTFDPNICTWSTDVTYYHIYMKSGDRERELTIESPHKYKYKPFFWILDTIDRDNGGHPRLERLFYRILVRIMKLFNIDYH